MLKVKFQDGSFIEHTKENNKHIISIGAKSSNDPKKIVVNSVELTEEQFNLLVSDINSKPLSC